MHVHHARVRPVWANMRRPTLPIFESGGNKSLEVDSVTPRIRILFTIVFLALASLAAMASGRTMSGAKGESYRYYNRSFFYRLVINLNGTDLPSFDCHVERTTGAEMDSIGDGTWKPLKYCMTVDGAQRVRVKTRSRLVLRDPWDGRLEPDPTATCDCSGTLEPGTLMLGYGPEDPTVPWPRVRFDVPGWVVWPDTCSLCEPLDPPWIIDVNDTCSLVINHPSSRRTIWVRSLVMPDSIPVLPGMSMRLGSDGLLDPPGKVLVVPSDDVVGEPGFPAESFFDVWNLSPEPATLELFAEDSDGWGAIPSVPTVTIPPGGFQVVSVMAVVPPLPGLFENMITLQATDVTDPGEAQWGASFVNVDTTATAIGNSPAAGLWLGECRPNPFNPVTEIPFEIGFSARVRLDVYDASGRHVTNLIDGVVDPGPHSITWNGRDGGGAPVASGVYFSRLEVTGYGSAVRKMVLLK